MAITVSLPVLYLDVFFDLPSPWINQDMKATGGGQVTFSSSVFDRVTGGGQVTFNTVHTLIEQITGGGQVAFGNYLIYPLEITGGGQVVFTQETAEALAYLATYLLNIETKRTYQFDNFNFTGFGRFNGKLIACNSTRIVDLETDAALDIAAPINANIELVTDFGVSNYCSIRGIYIDDDNMEVTITDADSNVVTFTVTAADFRGAPRPTTSKEFTIKAANIAGSQVILRRLAGNVDINEQKGF